jgi:hypothetical protein
MQHPLDRRASSLARQPGSDVHRRVGSGELVCHDFAEHAL